MTDVAFQNLAEPTSVIRTEYPEPKQTSRSYRVWVFMVNLVITLLALPLLAISSILLLLMNRFLNPGPLFFRQQRIGLAGHEFVIWKFRTMAPLTDEGDTTLIHLNEHRISTLGRVIRKCRVDELPNFVNVIAGHMNVIGPRPDATSQATFYIQTVDGYAQRFQIKPGITGVAQVVHGYAACVNQTRIKARYDRFYIENQRARLDLAIIGMTIRVMLSGFGSR